jgi:exopolysaccharide biosynthesis predicted pyruvyltransferase EpsI
VLGCGNLCQPFHFQINKIRHYAGHFERIYILPSSIDPDSPEVADFFGNPPPNLSVFCRERISFEKVTAITARPETVFLDHDLAMAVDYTPWRQRGSGNLNAFRTDRESMGHAVPADNMDVSLWGGSSDGGMLLRTVAEYRTVHTDRAHVAICAARLGKETHVYPNNYHKVRGIFEYSLRGLPDVCFHEQREM